MPLVLAAVSNHALDVWALVAGLAFLLGIYGQIVRSRLLVLAVIVVIAGISLYFVATGELQTFN